MSASYPTHAPASFRKGTTTKWTLAVSVYGEDLTPADGWTLKYYFTRTGNAQTVTATDNGDGTFLVTITKAAGASFLAGDYTYFAEVTKTIDTVEYAYEVDQGTITVEASSRVDGALDGRSTAQKLLDLVEALIEGKIGRGDVASYSISTGTGSRSLATLSMVELLQVRSKLRAEVGRELAADRIAKGLDSGRRILTRFEERS